MNTSRPFVFHDSDLCALSFQIIMNSVASPKRRFRPTISFAPSTTPVQMYWDRDPMGPTVERISQLTVACQSLVSFAMEQAAQLISDIEQMAMNAGPYSADKFMLLSTSLLQLLPSRWPIKIIMNIGDLSYNKRSLILTWKKTHR